MDNLDKIDIFIKTYVNDFLWLEYLLKSVKKFARGFRNVIIISDNDGNNIPDSILEIMQVTVKYIDIPNKMPDKFTKNNKNLITCPGYLWQQIVKLNWMDYTDADAVLLLDSDVMLTQPTCVSDLMNNQKRWVWKYRSWEFAGSAVMWKVPTQQLLQFEPEYEAMCLSCLVFERNTTIQFIEYLKKVHNATDLWDVLFKYDVSLFSEFNAYGSYVNKFDNDTFYYKIINSNEQIINNNFIKSWSYGGITEKDKKIRDALLV